MKRTITKKALINRALGTAWDAVKQEFGTTEWIRTTDPHHVKVVL